MGRRIMGPVRQAAYDAAITARQEAEKTADTARKAIFKLADRGFTVLEKICDVVDDVAEGKIKFKVFGKTVPFEVMWDIKEDR